MSIELDVFDIRDLLKARLARLNERADDTYGMLHAEKEYLLARSGEIDGLVRMLLDARAGDPFEIRKRDDTTY